MDLFHPKFVFEQNFVHPKWSNEESSWAGPAVRHNTPTTQCHDIEVPRESENRKGTV
jgi:hypothetical protein